MDVSYTKDIKEPTLNKRMDERYTNTHQKYEDKIITHKNHHIIMVIKKIKIFYHHNEDDNIYYVITYNHM